MKGISGFLQSIRYYYKRFGIKNTVVVIIAKITHSNIKIKVNKFKYPLWLRVNTSDISVYDEIIFNEEYEFSTTTLPKVIIDAGANIGLSSILFANKYPECKIIAIEPEKSNFDLLMINTSEYRNIIAIQAALWNECGKVNLIDSGKGSWGYMVAPPHTDNTTEEECFSDNMVDTITIEKIMGTYNISCIDILKMDIEGAEHEVFRNISKWIANVKVLIVELHGNLEPDCNRILYNNTNGFDHKRMLGEKLCLSRGNYLIADQ